MAGSANTRSTRNLCITAMGELMRTSRRFEETISVKRKSSEWDIVRDVYKQCSIWNQYYITTRLGVYTLFFMSKLHTLQFLSRVQHRMLAWCSRNFLQDQNQVFRQANLVCSENNTTSHSRFKGVASSNASFIVLHTQ